MTTNSRSSSSSQRRIAYGSALIGVVIAIFTFTSQSPEVAKFEPIARQVHRESLVYKMHVKLGNGSFSTRTSSATTVTTTEE